MFGWRGRIGYIQPATYMFSSEFDPVLPKGVDVVVVTLNIEALRPDEFERLFNLYKPAAEHLVKYEVGFIVCGGTPILTYHGYEKSNELARSIEEAVGIPTQMQLANAVNALRKLSAKKIVVATPYEEERNKERKEVLKSVGFDVLNIRGTGCPTPMAITKQAPHTAYRLAREVFLEAPEADAIYISCPIWEVVADIEALERDTGKLVVTSITADVLAALTAMRIKGPIKGYGRLLEML